MAENGAASADPGNGGRKRKAIGLFLLVLAATVIAGYAYWRYRQTHVSTDDAYIDGRIHLVSARVQGTVTEGRGGGGEGGGGPRRGQRAAVSPPPGGPAAGAAARQDVEAAKAHLDQLTTAVEAARAKTRLTAARLGQANRDAERMKALFGKQLVSRELYEKGQTEADVAKGQ